MSDLYRRRGLVRRRGIDPRRMADPAELGEALNAFNRAPKYVNYPDYKPTDDFSPWLSGLWRKIQNANGYLHTDDDLVKAEIVRGIGSRLTVGSALDTYERLTAAERADYDLLVKRLLEEFTDKNEKRTFTETIDFNKRKKNQRLEDFMQDIKKDMKRYSGLPPTIKNAANVDVPNPEMDKQGVRRFRAGMRDAKGKKDADLTRHLRFYLMDDTDLTWDNALKIASRWESATAEQRAATPTSNSSSDSDDPEEAAGAVATKEKKKSEKKSERITISTLADKVHENQMKIKGMETAQERLTAVVSEMHTSLKSIDERSGKGMQTLAEKLDNLSIQNTQGNSGSRYFNAQRQQPNQYQQQQQQQQPARGNWGQQNNAFGVNQRGGGGNSFRGRPQNYTWNGRNNQQRQMNFGFQRKTPNTLTTNATQTSPTTTVAAMGLANEEVVAPVATEEEEEKVTMPLSEFMHLTTMAGVDLTEDEFATAVGDLNFQ